MSNTDTISAFVQIGEKLIGSGGIFLQSQGKSVALSCDGNTLAVGAPNDDSGLNPSGIGATWVFTRNEGLWIQQGDKLVGSGGISNFQSQGTSVSLSSDGNTLAVGGPSDNNSKGAVWIFTRSGGVWTQSGNKLVGTGGTFDKLQQGTSVSLSGDGDTLAVGAPNDSNNTGATWIFTRKEGIWTQTGNKLVGSKSTGQSLQGTSVSLSSNGNTLAIGGNGDNRNIGATWIFTRTGNVWTQRGDKLVGSGGLGIQNQGVSVSLSSDGYTLAIGGNSDNNNIGATWIFTKIRGVWTQQWSKIVGTGGVGIQNQGTSVSLSSDGYTLAIGGNSDNNNIGSTWIFKIIGGLYIRQLYKIVGSGGVGKIQQGTSVALSGDGGTVVVGGSFDNSRVGASWIFTKSGDTFIQQGHKLVGSGGVGFLLQGTSVALSGDGKTLAVGGGHDNNKIGAVWIFTHIEGLWKQQWNKIVGSGGVGTQFQGTSVALSRDGNTLAVGGQLDNNNIGATWIFTRICGVWTQTGHKLVGSGGVGMQFQGTSVSLSGDGNTLATSGPSDNGNVGATWIFTRRGEVWTQTGHKLVGSGGVTSNQSQGNSICLSGDANTLAVGGPDDDTGVGAVWIFTRSGDKWTQTGDKLVGSGAIGVASQGFSVSLSDDGDTLLFGGPVDNNATGAVWIFTRINNVWTQHGAKLVGSGSINQSAQGFSVSLSNKNTLAVGGRADNSLVGAVWIFTRSGDLWIQTGNKLVGSGNTGSSEQGSSVSLSDNGDIVAFGGIGDNRNQGATWIFHKDD